ncbi:hypothetical protein [Maricaulis sp.]|uniref:hypothetical protein n=1 Tax=Maricaulis sp. TaxID=1486257 RepID=UPI00260816F2|nr:hypothetical protein [Maricaulis sp.]MDF1769881.1 hypothetical protein [Maricaulis sp.]
MTRHNTPRAATRFHGTSHAWDTSAVSEEADAFDAVLANYEHAALKLMVQCLYRQFHAGETAQAVRTATALLKSLPPVRRGNIWIDRLEQIKDAASGNMTREEEEAFILEPFAGFMKTLPGFGGDASSDASADARAELDAGEA